ncbi:MAG: hypothetical protein JSS79_20770 [Bacteroidetes bacterium]|nr:hypothetical protein [Bacteroidota bacterium]
MILDFKEIPVANSGVGNQDTFEMFSRDFLQSIGYEIIGEPTRGADGGIDIKVLEKRSGVGGQNNFFWLVSCKHYAHSGSAISTTIEQNIYDRVISNGCDGFIGFYSSISTSGLKDTLDGLSSKISYQIFDNAKIESRIVGISKMEKLFIRYFPNSYKNWKELYYYMEPIKLFEHYFDKKYGNNKALYKYLFGSIGNSIKQIRKSNTFKDALIENSTKLLLEPLLFEYFNGSQEFQYKKIESMSLNTFHKEHLPLEMKYKYGIDINPKPIFSGIDFEENQAYFLYPNLLIVNQTQFDFLCTMFNDLKLMLT